MAKWETAQWIQARSQGRRRGALLERALIAMQDDAGLKGQDIAVLLTHYACIISLASSGAEAWKELVDAVTTADIERWESGWRPDFLEP